LPIVKQFRAREILDSRGRPTLCASCQLQGGNQASASVPSGASTGSAEAHELRDGDPKRYGGLGCRKAAAHVNGSINEAAQGMSFASQAEFDRFLIALDGTTDKSKLGANAILACSVSFARASALEGGVELWQYFSGITGVRPNALPRLTINLLSGGKHAGQQVAIQDVLIVPAVSRTIDESLVMAYDVYQAAARLSRDRYGMRLLRADEGGLGPPCRTPEEMIELALEAIRCAGYKEGSDVALAVDVAASHFHSGEGYSFGNDVLSSQEMIERIRRWVDVYPIVSVEDGLAEDDWAAWPMLQSAIGSRTLVLGDDLLCTNPVLIERAVRERCCNALLLKANQVGTLTEAAEALTLARSSGWQITLSVRSGETEDDWAADLAVGWGANQFKNGSITQSERLAKYNRLLEIEEQTQFPVTAWPGLRPQPI
jgi:enolase